MGNFSIEIQESSFGLITKDGFNNTKTKGLFTKSGVLDSEGIIDDYQGADLKPLNIISNNGGQYLFLSTFSLLIVE